MRGGGAKGYGGVEPRELASDGGVHGGLLSEKRRKVSSDQDIAEGESLQAIAAAAHRGRWRRTVREG